MKNVVSRICGFASTTSTNSKDVEICGRHPCLGLKELKRVAFNICNISTRTPSSSKSVGPCDGQASRRLPQALVEHILLLCPVLWRFQPRATSMRLRSLIDAQAVVFNGLLHPSIWTSKFSSPVVAGKVDIVNVALRPDLSLEQDFDVKVPVTCMCFGQEGCYKSFVFFAVGSKDGYAAIFHCRRNDAELALVADSDFDDADDAATCAPREDDDGFRVTLHVELLGHTGAITSMNFISVYENELITASEDETVRFWDVDSGELMMLFTDESSIHVALCLPSTSEMFVAANATACLKLISTDDGEIEQSLKLEAKAEILTLAFDDTGSVLFAGTRDSRIKVFGVSDRAIQAQFEISLGQATVTCITFAAPCQGLPACLFVTSSDNAAKFIECIYDPPTSKRIVGLVVTRRLMLSHGSLPVGNCYSSSGGGYWVTASEDHDLCLYSLAGGFNHRFQRLKHHTSPVVAVAVNHQNTLLVSGDAGGRIVFWRRTYV